MSPALEVATLARASQETSQLVSYVASNWLELNDQVDDLKASIGELEAFLEVMQGNMQENMQEKKVLWVRKLIYKAEDAIEESSIRDEKSPIRRYSSKLLLLLSKKYVRILKSISKFKTEHSFTNLLEVSYSESKRRFMDLQNYRKGPKITNIFGFDDHKTQLFNMLTKAEIESTCSVISVVGMGGLGKTTLAKLVYDTPNLSNYFSYCHWISLSRNDGLLEIAKKMAGLSIDTDNVDSEHLRRQIQTYLHDKKYMIFFDDVWEENNWKLISQCLPTDGEKGSKVLITTRFYKVTEAIEFNNTVYELEFLNEEVSLKLFKHHLSPKEENDDNYLASIVRKCNGLPLAIILLGSLLKHKHSNEWKDFIKLLNTDNDTRQKIWGFRWDKYSETSRCLDILALSFHDLKLESKYCFLYFSSFPVDTEIDVNKLIKLWIADGVVKPRQDEELERTAYELLEDLINRNLVQKGISKEYGSIQTCRIHDMLHELAIYQAKHFNFFKICLGERTDDTSHVRRLSVQRGSMTRYLQNQETKMLKALLCFGDCDMKISKFKKLRVLNLKIFSDTLDDGIQHLIFLKYLELHGTNLKELPSFIGRFKRLQTLDVKDTKIRKIPAKVWSIKTLRHVHGMNLIIEEMKGSFKNLLTLDGLQVGSWVEKHLRKMESLRVLSLTHASHIEPQPYNCLGLPEEIEEIELRGIEIRDSLWNELKISRSLEILRLSGVSFVQERPACTNDIFLQLKALILTEIHDVQAVNDIISRLESLVFLKISCNPNQPYDCPSIPRRIKEIRLGGIKLSTSFWNKLTELSSLERLQLHDVSFADGGMECRNGTFLNLKEFKLESLHNSPNFIVENGAMTSMKYLEIINCEAIQIPKVLLSREENNHLRIVKHNT